MPEVRYVRLERAAELTGYTVPAMRAKIASGVWLEGRHWRKAPDGRILIDLTAYEQWAEGEYECS